MRKNRLTESQKNITGALDDVAEHVAWEFNETDEVWDTNSSEFGEAKITNIDGRKSFVKGIQSASNSDTIGWISTNGNGKYRIDIGNLVLSLSQTGQSGFTLRVTNCQDIITQRDYRRLDLQRRVHKLLFDRLYQNGYIHQAKVVYST